MKLAKNNSDMTINIQAVLKGDSKDIVSEIKKALGNTFTAKIGVDTNSITKGINEALKSNKINNVKLGVNGDALVKELNRITKGAKVEVVPIEIQGDIPKLPCKIEGALCVAPTKYYEGFFVVKLKKIK